MSSGSKLQRTREAVREKLANVKQPPNRSDGAGVPATTRPSAVGGPQPATRAAEPPISIPGSKETGTVDLERRRDQLTARFVELQWDLGGLVYEMAIRNRIRVDVIVQRAAVLQDTDAELGEVERILRMEQTGTAGTCASCGAPHSSGAAYCWQCGQPILEQVSSESIFAPGSSLR